MFLIDATPVYEFLGCILYGEITFICIKCFKTGYALVPLCLLYCVSAIDTHYSGY